MMEAPASKPARRKRRRACDTCRKRKVRCDGIQQGQTACTYCLTTQHNCTFEDTVRKWPPSKNYVGGLEARVEHLERILAQTASQPGPSYPVSVASPTGSSGEESESERDEFVFQKRGFEELGLVSDGALPPKAEQRFFLGETSHFTLVTQLEQVAIGGLDDASSFRIRPEFRNIIPGTLDEEETAPLQPDWPEPDLIEILVAAYFDHCNPFFPLLHRPTFLRQWADPESHRDRAWLSVAFGVLAVGAKFTSDPRVLASPLEKHRHSAGAKYWKEMRNIGHPVYAAPTLQRLQALVLSALYLMGTPLTPTTSWGIVGVAMRLVQDAGMHRRSARRAKANPFEYEMRKRVFWTLYLLDRMMTSVLDRPLCFREDDYDVELPLELDDYALEELRLGRAVVGSSNRMAAFNCRLGFTQIGSRALGSLYAARNATRSDLVDWERRVLVDLNSELNRRFEALPRSLQQLDSEDPDAVLDSGLVHVQYLFVQMLIHRPFLSAQKRELHPDIPALSICSNAARMIAHTVDSLRRRSLLVGRAVETGLAVFCAICILLMDVWEQKDEGNMESVASCVAALEIFETSMPMAGLILDILQGVMKLTSSAVRKSSQSKRQRPDKLNDPSSAYPSDIPGDDYTGDTIPPEVPFEGSNPFMEANVPFDFQGAFSQALGMNDGLQGISTATWPFVGDELLDSQLADWLTSMLGDTAYQQEISPLQ